MNHNEKPIPNPLHIPPPTLMKEPIPIRELTKTERKIISLLSDGLSHNTNEIKNCLYDVEGAEIATVWKHISNINAKIKPAYEIISVNTRGKPRIKNLLYRLVRIIRVSE